MKKIVVFLALLISVSAQADTFYCVPKNGGLFCKPMDFEHRQFDYAPPGQTWRSGNDMRSFRCYGKGETYKCLPFDEGAVLLETPHTCPTSPWGNNFLFTTTPTTKLPYP